MPFVYLTEQGAEIARRGQSLEVRSDGRKLADLEIHHVQGLCVLGRVHLTLPAMELLLRHRVETALLTVDGRLKGHLVPPRPHNVRARLAQYRQSLDPDARLRWAVTFVRAKLHNAGQMLRRHAYNHPESGLAREADEVLAAADRATQAADPASLRGIEGYGSRVYFAGLSRMCLGELTFPGRSTRPPKDPFNALLSFGYVLLCGELQALLEAAGLEPYAGFYHENADGRPSLALDLLEQFRHPVIDRFCLTLNNRRMLTAADFVAGPEGGFRLAPGALKLFLAEYDQWMRTSPRQQRPSPREEVRAQVEQLVGALRDGKPYAPYLFES